MCFAPYLHFIKEGPCLLQWYGDASESTHGKIGHFNQPFTQLLSHLPVALPLANLAVDDTPPLLGPANHSLPLTAEKCQFQVEFIPGAEIMTQGRNALPWMHLHISHGCIQCTYPW